MKIKLVLILSFLVIIVTGCAKSWPLQQVQSDIFLISLPVGTSEVNKNTDEFRYYFEYETPAPSDQSIYVEVFPWENSPKNAMEIIGKRYSFYNSINHGEESTFDFNTIKGVMYKGDDGDYLLKGEIFCFNKDGYTVVISSYGRYGDYRTIRDIVRSIKFRVPPMTKEQKAKAFAPIKIAKILSKQMKQALNACRDTSHMCDSTSWELGINVSDTTELPVVHIDSWLSSQAIEYLSDPTAVGSSNFRVSLLSPLMYLDIPIAQSLLMSEENYFVLSFNYYTPYGKEININF